MERYRYFIEGPLGTRLVGSVGHEPWALQSATASVIEVDHAAAVGQHELDGGPLVQYSDGATMQLGPATPLPVMD